MRYTVSEDGHSIDPASRSLIIEWRSEGHDGGDLAFGADRMLYITTGDGTGDSDTWNSGQSLDDLLGSVLRIDVRHPDADRPYTIPADNPFVATPDARGEIWAYGLRNPWRMSFDPQTNQLWVGNNGQDLWETAHLVHRGDNLGWSVYEGNHPFYLERKRGPTPLVPPTIEHSHAEFRSLTGGVVYHGDELPELEGAYIYGDYSSGRIWGMKHDGERPVWHRELADTALSISAFHVDRHGVLLVVDHLGGIYRLVPAKPNPSAAPFPTLLSETGLFESTAEHRPAPGVIPYSVNAPGWNDGATAERFLAVPGEAQIDYSPTASWNCPDGTALVQTLSLDAPGNRPSPQRIETRVLLRQQGEWSGYSYRWNAEQTDATLVARGGDNIELPAAADSAGQSAAWRIPSRVECLTCHSRAANFVLSLSEGQLNRTHDYGEHSDNQLRTLAHIDLLTDPPSKPPGELAALANPYDMAADVETRVRSYLQVNCAVCHVSAGGGNSQMELGITTPREGMKLLDTRPQHQTFGIANAMLVAPADPDRSVLVHRLSRRGSGQMPPLVTARVDNQAVELVRQWITALPVEQKIVQQWKLEELLPELPAVAAGRSLEAGQAAFRKTGCVQCHRFAGEGGTVGPDLSGIEKRLKAAEVLESILLPSQKIADEYASYAIQTDDGKTVAGRIERETERLLVVRPHDTAELPVEIDKALVVARKRLATSNMPEGTVNVLEKAQILDLLAYLLSGSNAPPPAEPCRPVTPRTSALDGCPNNRSDLPVFFRFTLGRLCKLESR